MITLDHVSKVYGDREPRVHALRDVSLRVESGEFLAIVGPSGSGKSTLLQIIGCLDVPTTGGYELDGVQVASMNDEALSHTRNRKIGYVFQSFNLIPRTTAVENVETPMLYAGEEPSRARALEVLGQVGLKDRASHFPTELSGGEQQRVAIARALVLRPALLIADEPTGNLDSTNGDQIMDLLGALHTAGLTVVMVTHDPGVARRAQRVVTMTDGLLTEARPAAHSVGSR